MNTVSFVTNILRNSGLSETEFFCPQRMAISTDKEISTIKQCFGVVSFQSDPYDGCQVGHNSGTLVNTIADYHPVI